MEEDWRVMEDARSLEYAKMVENDPVRLTKAKRYLRKRQKELSAQLSACTKILSNEKSSIGRGGNPATLMTEAFKLR